MASGRRTGFPWNMFWIIFLLWMDLYCSALPTPTVKDSNKVHVCPNNKTEWQKASKRLNCTSDLKNRYHCLPVRNLTTLMEFCYNETRPRITSGGCITYVPESNAMYKLNCSAFYYGCPDIPYFSDEIYAFPNCSNINPITRCYVADSSCPPTPANESSQWRTSRSTVHPFSASITYVYTFESLQKRYLHKRDDNERQCIPLYSHRPVCVLYFIFGGNCRINPLQKPKRKKRRWKNKSGRKET